MRTLKFLKRSLFLASLVLFSLSAQVVFAADPLLKSLVKIFCTIQPHNYWEPWRDKSPQDVIGSGCVLPGNRILTNAHVVSDTITIQVQKEGDTRKYTAKKEYVSHDCDLAILKVVDPKFFKGTTAVKLGSVPSQKDKLSVYGYPVGGEKLSITQGSISRIEVTTCAHSLRNIMAIQTQAPINPGNSGGPAFSGKKMIGVAFQSLRSAENTGYLIPIPVIKTFLAKAKAGVTGALPGLGVSVQDMENDSLKEYFHLSASQGGILVNSVTYGSSAWGRILENDVILSIDGQAVANDGTVSFRKGDRVNFIYFLGLHRIGDAIRIKVLRDGKPMTVDVKLKEDVRLIPRPEYDKKPSYFIFDGFIFTPLTTNYIYTLREPPPGFISLYYDGTPTADMKQIVLASHIIPHEINKGYDSKFENLMVSRVNGQVVSDMKSLIAAFQKPVQGRHIIEFDGRQNSAYQVILDADKSKQATTEILQQNSIKSDRSEDLQ